jgi:hypothetical protein
MPRYATSLFCYYCITTRSIASYLLLTDTILVSQATFTMIAVSLLVGIVEDSEEKEDGNQRKLIPSLNVRAVLSFYHRTFQTIVKYYFVGPKNTPRTGDLENQNRSRSIYLGYVSFALMYTNK